jgi:hypothetical protein
MEHHEGIAEYFKQNGVHAIFLFRRNLLRRMISVLANSYDKSNKPLNGTHKSHVHSSMEVLLSLSLSLSNLLSREEVIKFVSIAGRSSCEIQADNKCHDTDS